jgi:hypothetical protein
MSLVTSETRYRGRFVPWNICNPFSTVPDRPSRSVPFAQHVLQGISAHALQQITWRYLGVTVRSVHVARPGWATMTLHWSPLGVEGSIKPHRDRLSDPSESGYKQNELGADEEASNRRPVGYLPLIVLSKISRELHAWSNVGQFHAGAKVCGDRS